MTSDSPRFLDAASSEVESGVTEEGKPFCRIRVTAVDGTIILGQLTPDELRTRGLGDIECAEAAEQDAAVWRVIRNLQLPEELAAHVVRELRKMR